MFFVNNGSDNTQVKDKTNQFMAEAAQERNARQARQGKRHQRTRRVLEEVKQGRLSIEEGIERLNLSKNSF